MNRVLFRRLMASSGIGLLLMLLVVFTMTVYYVSVAPRGVGLFQIRQINSECLLWGIIIYMALVVLPLVPFREDRLIGFRIAVAAALPTILFLIWWHRMIPDPAAITGFWLVASSTIYQVWKLRDWRRQPESYW